MIRGYKIGFDKEEVFIFHVIYLGTKINILCLLSYLYQIYWINKYLYT